MKFENNNNKDKCFYEKPAGCKLF